MVLFAVIGYLMAHWYAWPHAVAIGLLLGMVVAQFVPTANACGLRRAPRESSNP